MLAVGLATVSPAGDAPDRIAGKDIRTGRNDWQRADLSGTGHRHPTLPMSVRCVSVYLCTRLDVDYLDGDRQFGLVVLIGARRFGVVDDYVYCAGCGAKIIRLWQAVASCAAVQPWVLLLADGRPAIGGFAIFGRPP